MATYKDQLHKIVEQSSFPKDRAEDIQHDMRSAFKDGSIAGEMIADVVSNTVGKLIDKLGVDDAVTWTTDGIKSMVSEAVMSVLESNELLKQMSESLASKQAARETNIDRDQDREMA